MKANWIKISELVEEIPFNTSNLAEVDAGGKTICLSRHNGAIHAFAHKCPHASARLAEGWIDALGNVVCPLHRYKFCPANGRNVSGEGYYLKHWKVEVREDGVYVALENKGLFGLL